MSARSLTDSSAPCLSQLARNTSSSANSGPASRPFCRSWIISTPAPSTASRNSGRSPCRSRASVHRYSRDAASLARRSPGTGVTPCPAQRRRASERERLRAPVHLGPATLRHGLDRGARKRLVVGEQPAQGLQVVESAVEQQRERPGQALDDLITVEERTGDSQR